MTRNLCWRSYLSCFEIPEDPISKQSQRWPEKLTSTPGQSFQSKVKLSVEVFFHFTQVNEKKLLLFSSKNVKIWSKTCCNNSNNACKECQMSELSHSGIFWPSIVLLHYQSEEGLVAGAVHRISRVYRCLTSC